MLVGMPKEIKNHECRVGLTPGSVREPVRRGHRVTEASATDADPIVGAILAPGARTPQSLRCEQLRKLRLGLAWTDAGKALGNGV